jgi:hypothetical protein
MKYNRPNNNYYYYFSHPSLCLIGNWVISGRDKKSFSPVQLPDTGTLFTGLKRLERETHHLPLPSLLSLPASSDIYMLKCLAGEKLSLSSSDTGKVELKFFFHTLNSLIRVSSVCIITFPDVSQELS